MVSYTKAAYLGLCASFVLSIAQAAGSDQMFKETASKAISTYRSTQDVSTLSRLIPELSSLSARVPKDAEARNTLLSVGLDMLNALYETADLNFDAEKKPLLNTGSPGGWYSSGTDPEGIKDPKMKAEYEKQIADNRRYAKHYTQQAAVSSAIDELAHLFRQGFPGVAAQDVSNLLARNGLSSSYCDDFLKRMERAEPLTQAGMQRMEPP